MNPIAWLAGPLGAAAASAAAVTTVILLLLMSVLLRRRNRRQRAYLSLIIGAALALVPAAGPLAGAGTPALVSEGMRLFSFLIINAGLLELYTPMRPRNRIAFAFLFLGAAGAVTAQAYTDTVRSVLPAAGTFMLQPVGLAAITSTVLMLVIVLPDIGQKTKYAASVAAVFIGQLFLAAGGFDAGAAGQEWIAAGAAVMPPIYYAIVFMLLFERVFDRLQSVYASSIRDGLTGLYNRRHFLKVANRYASRGLRVSVLFCDIDNFKRLNDTEGHQQADIALRQVAAILADELAGSGAAGRYGGEELVAAVARPGLKPAEIAEAIRKRVEAETPVTLSIGWSSVAEGVSVEEALKQADEAMYASKQSGKNKVTAYRPPRAKASPETG